MSMCADTVWSERTAEDEILLEGAWQKGNGVIGQLEAQFSILTSDRCTTW